MAPSRISVPWVNNGQHGICMLAHMAGFCDGPLTRYVKSRLVHAPGVPRTFSPPPRVGDPDMHHGTCVTQVPWCMPGSQTSGSLWIQWRRKRSQHSHHMRNPQYYVSGKRSMLPPISHLNDWTWPKHEDRCRVINCTNVLQNLSVSFTFPKKSSKWFFVCGGEMRTWEYWLE